MWFRGAGVAERAGLTPDDAAALAAEFGSVAGPPVDDPAEDPADVPVWRAARGGEAAWPSPWGEGRPGWHAECAAMALTTLGAAVDLHAGGADLRFPHHAYEAAMAEAVTGVRPFARAWMHVGTVRVAGAKMAKSDRQPGAGVGPGRPSTRPAALRLLLLDRPWARDWDYDPAELDAATARLERLYAAAARWRGGDRLGRRRRGHRGSARRSRRADRAAASPRSPAARRPGARCPLLGLT